MNADSRLQKHVAYCRNHSPFYRERLQDVDVSGITVSSLATLPLTGKDDLSCSNELFFAVEPGRMVDVVFSSGTTGYPVKIVYTEADLLRLAENERLALSGCGLTSEDVVLLTCTMDRCFIAGLAYFLGVRAIGAAAIRNGLGSLESHAEMLRRVDVSAIIGVPTFLRKLAGFLVGRGIDPAQLPVKRLICIGEPLRDADMQPLNVTRDIERLWGARAFSTYASSETITSFCECEAQAGGHLLEELGFVEIVDEQGRALPPGQIGEVVVTPFGIEGTPLLRFRTGDISFLLPGPCSCGRTSPRLGPILGRRKQMMKMSGTTLYPQAVFNLLNECPEVSEYYIEVEKCEELADHIRVVVSMQNDASMPNDFVSRFQARLRVTPEIVCRSEGEVRAVVYKPGARKPVRFIDRR